MSQLIVLLPHQAADPYAFVTSTDGQRPGRAGHTSAELLPAGGRGVDVVAVVPASRLSWHPATLPRGLGPRSPRLHTVLSGLLEEQLLQDPGTLHLALAPEPAPDGRWWVAACDRHWLAEQLQALETAGRAAARVVPELAPRAGPPLVLATGQPEDAWLLASGGRVEGVLALPLSAAALALLPSALPATDEATEAPPWTLQAEPAVVATSEQLLGRPVALLAPAQRLLAAAQSPWNLAQGPFARGGAAGWLKRLARGWRQLLHAPQWRALRWGVLALVLVQVIGLNLWQHRTQQDLAARRAQLHDTLTHTFDSVRVVVDAPVQMAREVDRLRQQTGALSAGDLESMLTAWARAAGSRPPAEALEFTPGRLSLQGLDLPEQERRQLQERLHQDGYRLQADEHGMHLRLETQP